MTTYLTAQPTSGPPTCCGAAMQIDAITDTATCLRCDSRLSAEASLRAGVDQWFADMRAKAIAAASIDGTAPAPQWDEGVPIPWCSREACQFWDGTRCYQLQAAPDLGVCDPVFNAMYPAAAPGKEMP